MSQRILYIEDERAVADLFKVVMDKAGYLVDLAESGEDGLRMFEAAPYPLVVTDHELGGITGLDVCRQLADHETDPALIIVTGKGSEEIVAEAMAIGVARYIPKIGEKTYTEVFPSVIESLLARRADAKQKIAAEATIRRDRNRFQRAEELIRNCHWESDETMTRWVYASPNTETLLGVPIEELLGDYENYIRYIHPDDHEEVRRVYAKTSEEGGAYAVRYRFCRPDGEIIHLFEQAAPVTDDRGTVLFYQGATRDITDTVTVEAHHRAVVENAVEAIISIDTKGIVQSFNAAAENLFQFSAIEVIGQNINMLMPEETAADHDSYMKRYLDTREARIIGIGREVEAQRKDGTVFQALLSVSELNVGGKISFTGLLRDISAQKESEASLIQAKNEAERANRAKSEFLSSMSHELRTPLNAVLGFAQMLEYNPDEPLTPTQQESVNLIKRGGNHLLTLINEVLELAKIEAGRLDLSIETVDLTSAIEECAIIASATATDRGIDLINATSEKSLPNVKADLTRLKQVLLNLLSNAVKYNRDAGKITIDASNTDDEHVRISVADTGIGLSEKEKRKIFEPFERLGKQTEDIEGTGIGLTITKQLVDMMNGRMGFESEPGEGSTFWIELPVSYGEERSHPERRKAVSKTALTGDIADPSRTYGVIYIEDNMANAQLMVKIFDSIPNAALTVISTAREGIQFVKDNQPDLVLMDINLPDMNGVEATKILQRNKETRHIPVIAVSASIWRARNGIHEDIEFFDYVEKPFELVEIRQIAEVALSSSTTRD